MKRAWLVALTLASTGNSCAAPGYRGPASDHFNGTAFFNEEHDGRGDMRSLLIFSLTPRAPWEKRDITPSKPPARVGDGALRVTFINHATVLLQLDGLNILADPVYSEAVGPVPLVGAHRLHSPGVALADLPPIDVVLLSHDHYDHTDLPTLRTLARTHKPRIIAGLGMKKLLDEGRALGGEDLDWWQTTELAPGIRVTAVPARHWTRRGVGDFNNTLWCGFVITTKGGPVYFAGDTGYGPHFQQVHARFGPMRAALIPIGAYKPQRHLHAAHMSPSQALDAHIELASRMSIAIHFGTFHLGFEGQDEAQLNLAREAERRGIANFVALEPGAAIDVPPLAP